MDWDKHEANLFLSCKYLVRFSNQLAIPKASEVENLTFSYVLIIRFASKADVATI